MNRPMTITAQVDFKLEARGRRRLGAATPQPASPRPEGRVPRVARLMALALHFEEQVRTGVLASYSALADLGHVTRARVSQIMNLVNLAPDIQEALLFLPRTVRGRDAIHLRLLQPIAGVIDWKKQRRMWRELVAARGVASPGDDRPAGVPDP
jgi:hypothetical protein